MILENMKHMEMVDKAVKALKENDFYVRIDTSEYTDGNPITVIYTYGWDMEVFCRITNNKESYELETYNRNTGNFGNLTNRKNVPSVVNYFNKFVK